MTKLPELPVRQSLRRLEQKTFAGYDRNPGSYDGGIYHMENLSSEAFPLLTVRKRRKNIGYYEKINGVYVCDGKLLVAEAADLRFDGRVVGTVTDTPKTVVALGKRLIIFPDKLYFNTAAAGVYEDLATLQTAVPHPAPNACYAVGTEAPYTLYLGDGNQWREYEKECGSLEAAYTGAVTFPAVGSLYDEAAANNTIESTGVDWSVYFKVGDAVTVSGTVNNNLTAVIREIDGDKLRFYENLFTEETAAAATVARKVPDFDYLCAANNRLWGCKGDEIRCSKLGDPFNFEVFDGIATDSYGVETGTAGDFTGCYCYLGYPTFFKEDKIFKIYGTRPADFSLLSAMSRGVAQGSGSSLAVAGERLFYLSPQGVTIYGGGVPESLQHPFGELRFREGCGVSDGSRYYLAATDRDGNRHLFCYDTGNRIWVREDDTAVTAAVCYRGKACFATATGELLLADGEEDTVAGGQESQVRWFAEFGDFVAATPTKKHLTKVILRLEPREGAYAEVWVSYDGGAYRQCGGRITGNGKKSCYLPLIPRRCDAFRLKISGCGPCNIYGLAVEYATGSPL